MGIPMNKQVGRGRCGCSVLPLVQRSEGYVNEWVLSADVSRVNRMPSQKCFYFRVPN